jgi:hypothetical protein
MNSTYRYNSNNIGCLDVFTQNRFLYAMIYHLIKI